MVRKISSICSKEVYKLHLTSIPVVLLGLAQRTQDKWHQVPFLRREFFSGNNEAYVWSIWQGWKFSLHCFCQQGMDLFSLAPIFSSLSSF